MLKKLKICSLVFILFMALSRVHSLDNCLRIHNNSLIKLIKSKVNLKDSPSKFIGYRNNSFVLNETNKKEIFVFIPVLNGDMTNFKEEIIVKLDISNLDIKIIEKVISSDVESIQDVEKKLKIKDWKVLKPNNVYKFAPWVTLKEDFGLKNYINLEKDGRVYYTVPSEDKLDDIHMVYESGNERKEFVFTNSPEKPIVPVEEVEKLGKKPEVKPKKTIMSQISSFFGFFTKHEEVKNEGYDYVDEHTKLKEKIY